MTFECLPHYHYYYRFFEEAVNRFSDKIILFISKIGIFPITIDSDSAIVCLPTPKYQ